MARSKEPPPRIPTLGALQRDEPHWAWLYCTNYHKCTHRRAMPLAPFVIRWGANASSNVLRKSARCSQCGHKGAALMHPSIGSGGPGIYVAFPVR